MKIKNLLFLSLLLALMAGNAKAQDSNIILSEDFEKVPKDNEGNWDWERWDWTVVNFDDNATVEIATNVAHASDSSFYVRSLYYDGCYLVSPRLTVSTGINVEFWCTNYWFGGASFKVGYITDNDITYNLNDFDPDEFEWGEVITANNGNHPEGGEDGWMKYNGEFPEGTAYIAIAFVKPLNHFYIDDIVFTEVTCGKPSVPEIDAGKNSLTLTWTGNSDNYELQYKAGYSTTFDNGLEGWTTFIDYEYDDDDEKDSTWIVMDNCVYSTSFGDDSEPTQFYTDNYLVSPSVELGGSITFLAKGYDMVAYEDEHFGVAVYNSDDEIFEVISEWTAESEWTRYSVDLTNYKGEGYVAIVHLRSEGSDPDILSGILVDNITIFTSNVWNSKDIVFSNQKTTEREYTLDGLMRETTYALQLRSVCGANEYSSWTDMVFASTKDNYRFIHAGNWNDVNNWEGGVPEVCDDYDVTIAANVTIPNECVAIADNILVKYGSTITIQDGGQLKHNNEGVVATMEKNITPYSDSEVKDHYYLFGLPVLSSLHPSQVANMMTEDDDFQYDIYYFDESEEQEWKNIKAAASQDNFWFYPTKGFLYARDGEDPVTLSATGELNPSNGDGSALLYYTNNEGVFAGWNLIANPFPCNASLENDRAFYRLEEVNGESKIVPAIDNVIAPMEGIFVQTNTEGESVTFIPVEETEQSGMGSMNFSLRKAFMRSEVNLDRSLIRFGEGHNMGHLDLMADPNRLFIPLDGKAMSVVYSQPVGEMPLNFEAADDGTFVLCFTNNAEDLAYCHLIDNMTGADIDLLKYPEYTFQAKNDDYASRFRVVFVAKDTEGIAEDSETFAFNSYGSWIIVNEGLATLQMVDINGRVLRNEQIEGYTSMKFNVAPGVYVLRLVNGENVRVQKVIVR